MAKKHLDLLDGDAGAPHICCPLTLHIPKAERRDLLGNAPTESWFNSFKNERVHGLSYETRDEMKAMTFEYIEVLYNRKRQHSTLGYKSPIQFLDHWLVAQQKGKLVA